MTDNTRSRPVIAVFAGTLVGLAVTTAVILYSSSSGLEVRDAAVGATAAEAAAVYFSIANGTANEDELIGASCACAEEATLHVSRIDGRGVASMEGVTGLEVPAGSTEVLEPGGSHVMLERLEAPLRAGDTVSLRLDFASGTSTTVDVAVVELSELSERSTDVGTEGP